MVSDDAFSDPTDIDELSADCEEPKPRKKGQGKGKSKPRRVQGPARDHL
jgi:hypothetical protein